jgi:hypothetical protein
LKKEWREMFLNITLIESLVASQKSWLFFIIIVENKLLLEYIKLSSNIYQI